MSAAESHILPVYSPPEQIFVRGEGCWIWDDKGDKYLDCIAGIAVNALGHASPVLVKALTEQANKLWHTLPVQYRCRAGATEAQWVQLREALFEARSAQAEGREVDASAQAVLSAWAQDPGVSAANINLQARLAEVTTAWDEALR